MTKLNSVRRQMTLQAIHLVETKKVFVFFQIYVYNIIRGQRENYLF